MKIHAHIGKFDTQRVANRIPKIFGRSYHFITFQDTVKCKNEQN